MPEQPCRPCDRLAQIGREYPTAWKRVAEVITHRDDADPLPWPRWCFLPTYHAFTIARQAAGLDDRSTSDMDAADELSALAAWRVTQGIYRFDPAVYEAVRNTPVGGGIPCDILYQLPEWCVYIETPDLRWAGRRVHGVFAHLATLFDSGTAVLGLLLDVDDGPLVRMADIALLDWCSLSEAIEWANKSAMNELRISDADRIGAPGLALKSAEPIISLLLYLCSQAAQIGDGRRVPAKPGPKQTKRGARLFWARKPTVWNVGVRLGAALRAAYAAEETGHGGAHAGPLEPVRPAHWHTFVSGPGLRDDGTGIPASSRRRDLRWLPPIAVNLPDIDALPATIYPVR